VDTSLTRRDLFATAAGGAALTLGSPPVRAASPATPGVDPAAWLDAIVRVIGRSDGGIVVRWTDGVLSANAGAEATPLFRVLSQIYSRHRRRADGGYDAVVLEIVYFTDLATRQLLTTWRNPWSGQDVPVPLTALGPTPFVIRPSLAAERAAAFSAGAPFSQRYGLETSGDDDVWVSETLDSVIPPPSDEAAAFGFHEHFTFHASRAALEDRSRPHVASIVQKSNVLSYRPWMLMGDRPGTTTTRGHGRVLDDLARLPPAFIALNREHGRPLLEGLDRQLAL
jgi:hypothetical protein